MSVYPFIEAEKVAERNVASACALMEVSRSAFYGWHHHQPGPRALEDAKLEAKIVEIHAKSRAHIRRTADHCRPGPRRRWRRPKACGPPHGASGVSPDVIRRRKIRTTIPDPEANPTMVDRLGRAFDPESVALDRIYIGDITYIRTHEGWLYLATCHRSREPAGRRLLDGRPHAGIARLSTPWPWPSEPVIPQPGFVFHSDRGSQYTSGDFRKLLDAHKGLQSLSRPRQCWDNAVAESFFSTLKEELVYRSTFPTRAAARAAIFEFIEVFYNRSRLHSTLGNLTPAEYEEQRLKQPEAA